MAEQNIIPINVDRNVSFRDYRHIEGKKLLVADRGIFYTFQGEGPFAGQPCVFLRLAGCNIGAKEDCPWCDTKFFYEKGREEDPAMLFEEIRELAGNRTRLIIVTGGEPLLQTKSLEVFASIAQEKGWHIQVETNGYFVDRDTLPGCTIVVSPKIPHNKKTYLPYKPAWAYRGVHLKYVVSEDEGNPYHRLPEDVLLARHLFYERIYVSAMCVYKRNPDDGEIPNIWDDSLVDREATGANYRYAAQYAVDLGLKVSYQTHLFGAKE